MKSKSLHMKLDQKLENLKTLMGMQDDVVFKEVFIPSYECSGLFVYINGTWIIHHLMKLFGTYQQRRLYPIIQSLSSNR
ncbi:hypothetical protein ASG99_18150 [Bacillus sp. Soil768D1]|nr:hypothetical protein ASG99_18150 [Bacillus sp. Soil768D1]